MSTPISSTTCSRCGGAKQTGEPCPHCLLQLGLAQSLAPGTRKPRPAPPTPEEIAPHFPGLQLEAVIGQGGMGVVYRARQKKLDRTVALKILAPELSGDPAFAERFLREARAMARLEHKNIVAVHDFGETDGLCWILMEHVEGVNLRQALASGRLAPAQALAIVPQLCDALAAAHAQGVVHRDIKPENVLLAAEGVVKVADFGLAKLSGPGGADMALTGSDAAVGTLHYMAPEQLVGAREVDHRADIYSLGVVFYEMLTGELPLGRFEPPSHRAPCDAGLDDIVLRTLARAPESRYQQAVEVKTDVQGLGNRATAVPQARPPEARPPVEPQKKLDVGMLAFIHVLSLLAIPSVARNLLGWPGGLAWSSIVLGILLTLALSSLALVASGRHDARFALDARKKREFLLRCLGCATVASIAIAGLQYGVIALWEEGTDLFQPSTVPQQLAAYVSNPVALRALFELEPEAASAFADAAGLNPPFDPFLRAHGVDGRATIAASLVLLPLAALFLARRAGQTSFALLMAAPALALLTLGYARWRFDGGDPLRSTLAELKGTTSMIIQPRVLRAGLQKTCEERGYEVVLVLGTRNDIEVLAVQPRAWNDRWELSREGPRLLEPGIVFGLARMGGSNACQVVWDAGAVSADEPRMREWTAEIESLLQATKRAVGG